VTLYLTSTTRGNIVQRKKITIVQAPCEYTVASNNQDDQVLVIPFAPKGPLNIGEELLKEHTFKSDDEPRCPVNKLYTYKTDKAEEVEYSGKMAENIIEMDDNDKGKSTVFFKVGNLDRTQTSTLEKATMIVCGKEVLSTKSSNFENVKLRRSDDSKEIAYAEYKDWFNLEFNDETSSECIIEKYDLTN
jgi:hypothetical protein